MAQSTAEVTIGTGELFIGDTAGETKPTVGVPPTTGWTSLGFTESGFTFAVDRTFEDILVAEEFDPIDILKTAQNIRILGELAQPSGDNIAATLGGTYIAGDFVPPATTDAPVKKALCLYLLGGVPGDSTKDRLWYVHTAISSGAFQVVHAKAPQKQLIAVEFRAVKVTGEDIFHLDDEQ